MTYTSEHPINNVTVDVVARLNMKYLFIKRGKVPFAGYLALPGGFVNTDETTKQAAARELLEETNLKVESSELTLLKLLDDPHRDPRGRTISLVYLYVDPSFNDWDQLQAGDDANEIVLIDINDVEHFKVEMAFDHCNVFPERG